MTPTELWDTTQDEFGLNDEENEDDLDIQKVPKLAVVLCTVCLTELHCSYLVLHAVGTLICSVQFAIDFELFP